MIEKLKEIFKRIFRRNKVLLLDKPDDNKNKQNFMEEKSNDFLVRLRQQTYLNQNDGNGYGIIKNIKVEDII